MQSSRGSMNEQPIKAVGLVAGDDFSWAIARKDETFCVPSKVNIAPARIKNASAIRLLIISSRLKNEVEAHHQAFSFSCLPFSCLPFSCLTLFPRSRKLGADGGADRNMEDRKIGTKNTTYAVLPLA